jgi:hypothetical protein
MAALWKAYSNEVPARRAAAALRAAGVPPRDLWLLTGHPLHDIRTEPAGTFAGSAEPGAPVGTFANDVRLRCQGAGTFAGDADRQRQGSFADANRELIVSYDNGAEHARVAGDPAVRQVLRSATVGDTADRVVDELHLGHAAVLVEVAEITAGDAAARLEEAARAA